MDGFQYVFPILALLRGGTKEDNKNKRIAVFESAIKNIQVTDMTIY